MDINIMKQNDVLCYGSNVNAILPQTLFDPSPSHLIHQLEFKNYQDQLKGFSFLILSDFKLNITTAHWGNIVCCCLR